jgi:hypothetical protein
MTDTTTAVTVPGFVTMIDQDNTTLPALAQIATDLLVQGEYQQLPAPHYLSISHGGQSIALGFGRDLDACHALARWAEQFGGTVTGTPHQSEEGQRQVYCQVGFIYGGARVELSAFIPASQEGNADD